MSANSYDAIPRRNGRPPNFDAPEPALSDPTEDIADEITSELAGVREPLPAVPHGNDAVRAASAETGPPPAVGSVLRDRYVLEAEIGGGGTALVYQALDRRRDDAIAGAPRVAVKLLRPERREDPHSIARLQREFRQTQAAAHPGVVRFLDLDCERGSWFIVMELLAGESLAAQLRRAAPGGLQRGRALEVAAGLAEALAHAHRCGVVHGDVKPANVFLIEDGQTRLLDFGVAPEPGDPPGPVAATRRYASPEVQGGSPAGARDDVFSVACVACESLTGEHPFGRGGAKAAGPAGRPRQPDGLDDATWQVLRRALEGSRALRPDMDELARVLRAALDPGSVQRAAVVVPPAVPVAVPAEDPAPPPEQRRPRLIAGAATAVVLALALGNFIGRRDGGTDPVAAPVPASPLAAAEMAAARDPAATAPAHAPKERASAVARPRPGEVAVAALPVPAGEISFDLPAMSVSKRAVVAAIPLRHVAFDDAARDAQVNWRLIEGSARPGQDIGGPVSGVESFAAGNTFRILYVPIVANLAATRDRTFVVELTGASPGVQLGRTPRVAVTILGDR